MCSEESQWPCLWFLPLTWCWSNSLRGERAQAAKQKKQKRKGEIVCRYCESAHKGSCNAESQEKKIYQKKGTQKKKPMASAPLIHRWSGKCAVQESESALFPFSTLPELSGRLIGGDLKTRRKKKWRSFQWTDTPWLQSFHPALSFSSLLPFFFTMCQAENEQTILCVLADFLRPLIKLSNKWSHDVMNLREARNNKSLLRCRSNSQRFTPRQTVTKYLPTLVKQSGIILNCYNAEKRLSYFPYFLLILWGQKQGGGIRLKSLCT